MSKGHPRIWVLLGPRTGDNNQALALAEALGLPFETRTLSYNLLRALGGRVLGRSLLSLEKNSQRQIEGPWPDLIIAIGRRSVPVGRWVQRANGGATKLVRIGNPRIDAGLFDLVVTTRQYPVPPGQNVLLLPVAMSRFPMPPPAEADEEKFLAALHRPHLLMAVGGATKYWTLAPDRIAEAARKLAERARKRSGSLIAVASPRTDPHALDAVRAAFDGRRDCALIEGNRPRFPVLLADADEVFVTGDSVSMLSEAIIAGKPVGLIPLDLNPKGHRQLGDTPDAHDNRRRDLRHFWNYLREERLVGTIERPIKGTVADPAQTAAAEVRKLLGDLG